MVQRPALAYAAWRITGDAPRSLRALVRAAVEPDHERLTAIQLLGKMGPAAKSAVPDLLFLYWGNYQLRPACGTAILEIDPSAARFTR